MNQRESLLYGEGGQFELARFGLLSVTHESTLRKKYSYSEFFCVILSLIAASRIFPQRGKIRNRKTPNTDTFHAVVGHSLNCKILSKDRSLFFVCDDDVTFGRHPRRAIITFCQ